MGTQLNLMTNKAIAKVDCFVSADLGRQVMAASSRCIEAAVAVRDVGLETLVAEGGETNDAAGHNVFEFHPNGSMMLALKNPDANN